MKNFRLRTFLIFVIVALIIGVVFCLPSCGSPEENTTESETADVTDNTAGSGTTETESDTDPDNSETTETGKGETSTSDETGSDETESDETESDETKSDETESDETESDETNSDETDSKGTESGTDDETETVNTHTHNYDAGVVTKQPTCKETGTKLYTCTLCGATKEETLKVTTAHTYGDGVVLKEATCKETGTILYTCTVCGATKEDTIPTNDNHVWDKGIITKQPTYNELGIKLFTCSVCKETKEEPIDKLPPSFTITLVGIGEYFVGPDGSYDIGTYDVPGYNFIRWETEDGKEFKSKGTIDKNVVVTPVIEIIKTTSQEQLEELLAAGAEKIFIASDIVVSDHPIFVSTNVTIYADSDVSIIRAADYAGAIFVVGVDKDLVPSVLFNRTSVLTLGGGKGTLYIDGNRDNTTVTVVGTAILVTDSAVVNIYDGTVIQNHAKDGNDELVYTLCTRHAGEWMATRAGGAAIMVLNGNVNMYGGVITNNWARTDYTVRPNEEGIDTSYEDAACGGAIYNCGNFNMYGGTISNNEALRGAAIYNDEIVRLEAGTITGNYAHTYGGAISSSSTAEAQMFIGTEKENADKIVFLNNIAGTGGALYSNASSPIVILGNARFEGNEAQWGGGAIYTGGALTVRDTEFVGNKTTSSGGAIYFWYNYKDNNKSYLPRRHMELTGCVFAENDANLGGAIVISASAAAADRYDYSGSKPKPLGPEGAYAEINDCIFEQNHANNCGALYVTRHSDVFLNGVEFTGNSAEGVGGAMSVQTGCTVTLDNIIFEGNFSNGSAGALYVFMPESISLNEVDFIDNQALGSNGGALYFNATTITLDDSVSFTGNKAVGHGGAIYASYTKNEDESLNGATLVLDGTVFENNTALAGGAISARSASTIIIDYVNFLNCQTPDAKSGEDTGGGAIYSNSSTLTMTGVTFDGCYSGYYGGVLKLYGVDSTLTDVTIKNASGGTGAALFVNGGTFVATNLSLENVIANVNGAIYAASVEAVFNDLKVEDCVAHQGGAIYASGETAVITINNGTFENTVAHNGGAIYAVKATVNLNGCTFNTCVATNGGAIFADQAKLNVSGTEALPVTFNGNNGGMASVTASDGTVIKSVTASTGGALYMRGSTVVISGDVLFNGYTVGYQGGAIYCKDYSYTVTTPADPEVEGSVETTETILVPSSLTVNGAKFSDNVATSEGGAIYFASTSHYDISNTVFENNEAKGIGSERGGGAIYSTVSTGYLGKEGAVTFIGNHSHKGGAVAIHSDSKLYVYSVLAQGNYADYLVVEETTDAGTVVKNKFGYGGVFYANSSHLYLEEREGKNDSIVFGGTEDGQGNYAVSGGVIYIEKNAIDPTLSVKGAEFINNRSTYVQGTSFNNSYGGGAIRANKTNITLTGVTLDGNSSDYYGGAVHAFGGTFTMDGGSVVKNNRGGTGAAIFLSGVATPKIADTEIKDNVSKANGIVYCSNSQLTLENVTATGNTAANGGVLYISGSASTLTVTGGKYEDNDAKVGGALWISGIEGASISGATFKNNEATSADGGAIYLNATRVEITDSTFEANRAKNHGGAIALFKTVANLNGNNKFVGNVAENHGGAIHVMYVWNEDGTERLPSELIVSGGIFDGNKALGGGAISIRSECFASFDGTTFINNEALGQEDTADGDGEGGGAIYNGWGTLHLTNSTLTNNKSQGHFGGAVNSAYGATTISGTTTIKNNTNGVYVVGKDLMIRDTVIITDNERSNVYLNGRKLMLVGELSADSVIGVMSSRNGEFVVADGENVTDVLLYKNSFTADLAPIYEEGGKLLLGFFATQNPLSSNDYTFGVNGGAPTYQWQVLEGEIWINVEGATSASLPTSVATGKTYRCVATLSRGEAFIELTSTTLKYTGLGTQTHTVCGSACDHADHEALTWYPIGSIEELLAAGKTAGNYYLTCDLETSKSIKISADVNICLNGYTLSAANNESKFSIITVGTGASLNLTDCGENATKHTVYVKDGQLVDAGTEGAIEIELTGGIISGGYATTGGALYSVEAKSINVYNVNFVGNRATGQAGAVYLNKVGSNTDGLVVGYTFNNVTFVANSVDASKYGGGAIYTTNSHGVLNNATMIGNHSFKGGAVALHTTSTLTVNGLTAEHNFAQSGEYLDGETIRNGLGVGGVFYVNSSSLNIVGFDGDVNVLNNSAVTGGVICVEWNNTDAYDVKISGANVSNNAATGNGGAISINAAKGALTVMNSTFSENNAANGGAIHFTSSSGTLTVDGSRFDSNTASGNGGALYVSTDWYYATAGDKESASYQISQVTIKDNAYFGNNETTGTGSNGYGGAIYLSHTGNVGSTLNITGGTFEGNKAQYGGAIAGRTATETTLTGVTFKNNEATVSGGAIYTNASSVNVIGGSFEGNSSTYDVKGQNDYDNNKGGGAIFATGSTLELHGVTLKGNSTGWYGGAITAKDGGSVLIDEGCIIEANVGATGAAFNFTKVAVTIKNSSIINNVSSYNGVVYQNGSTLTVENVAASGNIAVKGGVFFLSGSVDATITGGTYSSNYASDSGAVVYMQNTSKLTVDNTAKFMGNGTKTEGEGEEATVKVTAKGGVICVDGGTVTLNGSTFENNTARDGGAIYVGHVLNADKTDFTSTGALVATDTIFRNNEATGTGSNMGGGAICVNRGEATLNGVELDGNKSAYYGGAISAYDATVTIQKNGDKNSVIKNSVGETGLAITFKDSDGTNNGTYVINGLNLTDNNPAKDHGGNGVIYINEGELTVDGLTATGNSNKGSGVIHASTGAKLTVKNSTFESNSTAGTGAAINFVPSTGDKTLLVENTDFISNTATGKGGAINAGGSTVVTIANCTFTTNESDANGGAIYASTDSTLCIDNSTFDGNKSIKGDTSSGGAIYGVKSTITITGDNTCFKNNQADRGGAIYITHSNSQPSTLEMMGGKFEQNSAAEGGAISIRSSCTATFNGTSFINNTTDGDGDGEKDGIMEGGGAIYVGWSTLNLSGVTLDQNSATNGTGGAILANGATFKISGKVVISNNKSGNTTASNVTLLNNTVITVVGALDPETSIGITAKDGTVVKGDGTNVTDVSGYVGMFFHDDNKPVYVDGTVLKSGLLVIQQPTRFNGYTFVTTCTNEAHYQWYVVENGMPVIVDGATGYSLTNAISGKTYVCIVTCGSTNVMSDNYYYCNEEPEKLVCGESCDHETTHETVKWLPISNAEELALAGKTGGYYYLVQGIQLNKTVVIESNAFISLNGFDITLADGASGFSFFNVPASVTLTLTDWSSTDRGGYIDANGAWMPGYYAEATSFVSLGGGVINGLGNSATSGGAIYAEGNVVVYNVDFVNHTAGNGGAIYLAKGATLLTEGSSFVANKCTSGAEDGDLRGGGAVYTIAAKATFKNTSFYNNKAAYYGGAVVAYGSEVSFNGGEIKENNGGTGAAICFRNDSDSSTTAKYELTNVKITYNHATNNGIVYMQEGTLTMNGVEATHNTSDYVGGFMYVSSGVVNMANSTVQSNTAKSSGAIQLKGSGVKLNVSGRVIISGNVKQVSETESVSNNLELTNGKLYIAGALTEGSNIGVTANDGAFVTGVDGLDVADYVEFFTHDGGKPVYAEDGSLKIGFVVTQQPSIDNNYTVVTNGQNVTYQWFMLEGEFWTEVAGATSSQLPDSAVSGSTYKCTVTLTGNGITVDSDSTTYFVALDPHEHTVCGNGTDCTHGGEHNGELISWSPITSVSDLIAAGQSGGSFYLVCDIELDESVVVSGNLSLCLNGYTLSAVENETDFSLLTVSAGATLTVTDCGAETSTIYVKDGVLVDSTTPDAIEVEITGGMITGGHAVYGSAIYSSNGAEINLYNVNFVNNRSTGNGGAIYVFGDVDVYVCDSTFVANSTTNNGGAVDIVGATMTANGNNEFLYNTAGNHGGAIYVVYLSADDGAKLGSTLTMTSGTFEGNAAGAGGGAVSMRTNGSSTFTSTIFNNNRSGEGGAIYANNSELSATGCTFDGNSATTNGGAIYATSSVTATVTGSTFDGNSATTNGGAIYAASSVTATVTGSTFDGNSAISGGAIYASGSSTTVENTTVKNTSSGASATAETSATGGGAIFAASGTLNIIGGSFESNTSLNRGGALYVDGGATLTVNGTTFDKNVAQSTTHGGGVLYITGSKGTVSNVTLTNNESHRGGAIAVHAKSEFTVKSLTATGNKATANEDGTQGVGGVFYVNSSTLNLVEDGGDIIMNDNSAVKGGAICVEWNNTDASTLNVKGASFNNNSATSQGGAICVSGKATVTVTGGSFESNAARYGGAIYASSNSELDVNDVTFNNNVASATVTETDEAATNGGAISAKSAEVTVTDCTFTGNNVSNDQTQKYNQHGGAIYAESLTLTVSGTTFTNNSSSYYGGAIAAKSSEVSITGGSVSGSKGITGAALWFNGCSKLTVEGTNVSNNSHGGNFSWASGIIYVTGGSENLFKNVTASNNNIVYNGGVFYLSATTATIDGGSFSGNSAKYGGVIYVAGDASQVTVTGGAYEGNTATTNGGAIYIAAGTVNVTGGTYEGNKATTNGGAIYVAAGTVNVTTDAAFISNTAKYGGAIYMAGGTLNAINATFTSNQSNYDSNNETYRGGGAILASKSTVTLAGCTFDSNYSKYYGGTIAAYDSTLTIKSDDNGEKSSITNSEGATGAAICFRNGDNNTTTGTYVIDGLTLTGTVGSGSGVIYINDGTLSINELTAESNSSTGGGIIHASGGNTSVTEGTTFTITNSTFKTDADHKAPNGAINLTAANSSLTLQNVSFEGDYSNVNITSSCKVTVNYSTDVERTNWETVLGTGSNITYTPISTQQQ